MALTNAQKIERANYLEKNLTVTECSSGEPYVFISYASDNWETVFKGGVVPLQKQYGLRVFADKAFDKVNDKWIVPMLRNIRGADLMIAFVSQSYIESYACFLELLTAINSKKQIIFVSLDNDLHVCTNNEMPAIERGVKNELLNQGANIITSTNNTSNDIMRAIKFAFTSISTFIEQDSLSKYDISDAFINFFDDASINRKTIDDLNALQSTIRSISEGVFRNADEEIVEPAAVEELPQENDISDITENNSGTAFSGEIAADSGKTKKIIIISAAALAVIILAILLIVSFSGGSSEDDELSASVSEITSSAAISSFTLPVSETTTEIKKEKGSFTNENGDLYEGEMLDGIPNGQGTMKYADGTVYEGNWIDGKREGTGSYGGADPSGVEFIYSGDWENDERNGQGTETWVNGESYTGNWADGMKNGKGTTTYANGDVYEGEYKNGVINGQGTYIWANGDIYEGEFRDNIKNGHGTMTFADGDAFEGEFINGDIYQGTYTGKDTDGLSFVYEGEFSSGLPNGQGTCTWEDGNVKSGTWKNGVFIS